MIFLSDEEGEDDSTKTAIQAVAGGSPSMTKYERKSIRENWCGRLDLNQHTLRHTPLKRACLPFHHDRIKRKDYEGLPFSLIPTLKSRDLKGEKGDLTLS
jgi:hypothetical protein